MNAYFHWGCYFENKQKIGVFTPRRKEEGEKYMDPRVFHRAECLNKF